jgi:hypothetical protein
MKAAACDENAQGAMAEVLEYLRLLRDESGAAIAFVHHSGHTGSTMRGLSDLESVWESRIAWERDGQSPIVSVKAEHREVEETDPFTYRIRWDELTRSMRLDVVVDDPAVSGPPLRGSRTAAASNGAFA